MYKETEQLKRHVICDRIWENLPYGHIDSFPVYVLHVSGAYSLFITK